MPANYHLAASALNIAGINMEDDFHTLSSMQVDALVDLAAAQGYRKPKEANGSTARYYFAALQRQWRRRHD